MFYTIFICFLSCIYKDSWIISLPGVVVYKWVNLGLVYMRPDMNLNRFEMSNRFEMTLYSHGFKTRYELKPVWHFKSGKNFNATLVITLMGVYMKTMPKGRIQTQTGLSFRSTWKVGMRFQTGLKISCKRKRISVRVYFNTFYVENYRFSKKYTCSK